MAEHTVSDSDYRNLLRLTDIAAKYGGPEGLQGKINKLEEDAATFRTKARDLEGKVVPDGATVLTADDAKRWDAFQALGKTPDELAAGVVLTPDERKEWEAFKALEMKAADVSNVTKERDELKAKDAQRSRLDLIAALAKAEGLPEDAVPTIADLGSLKEADFEVKDEKVKDEAGKEVTKGVGYVILPGQPPVKFSEYRLTNPVLKGIRAAEAEKPEDKGTRWHETPTGGAPGVVRTAQDHAKAVAAQLDYNV